MGKIVIDPVTRIEGHMKIECTVDGGVVEISLPEVEPPSPA